MHKFLITLKKNNRSKELGLFASLALIFVIFDWRLFAFGSQSQLFLYGDNLPILNNLYYIFVHFDPMNIFGTYIGKNGMLGSYPMAEPQSSIFYPPIFALFIIFRALQLNAAGLYYELLIYHSLHFIVGAFFIHKICNKIFRLDKKLSFIGAVTYLCLGWNVLSLDAGSLSNMVGVLPILFYAFFLYLKSATKIRFYLLILAFSFFLFAGGIVNFFFYVWLNFALILAAAAMFKLDIVPPFGSRKELIKRAFTVLVIVPLWGVLTYTIQLVSSYYVLPDITHSATTYGYLSFSSLRLSDLVGLIFPRFALIGFGSTSSPQFLPATGSAGIMYMGLIPLALCIIGLWSTKSRTIFLFSGLILVNLILAFGGLFFLYDLTFMVPTNSSFRGNSKYLFVVGMYVAILIPFTLGAIEKNMIRISGLKHATKNFFSVLVLIGLAAIVASFITLSSTFFEKSNPSGLAVFNRTLDIFSNNLLKLLLIAAISLPAIWTFVKNKKRKKRHYLLLALILGADFLINRTTFLHPSNYPGSIGYFNFFETISNYMYRTILIAALSLFALWFFIHSKSEVKYAVLLAVLLLDVSVNYKYADIYHTNITELTSKTFFACCQNQTVVNDLNGYSQMYFIPEISGVDPFFQYSAIPNKYLVAYDGLLLGGSGKPDFQTIVGAGIQGILSTSPINDPHFQLVSTVNITESNYKDLYAYNANGDIHNDWGENPFLIGSQVRYYKTKGAAQIYFTNSYRTMNSDAKILSFIGGNKFNGQDPVVLDAPNSTQTKYSGVQNTTNVSVLENKQTFKKIELSDTNVGTPGLLFLNIPYSHIWSAKIDGKPANIKRTNYAFSGIEISPTHKNETIELSVNRSPLRLALVVSIISGLALLLPLTGELYAIFKKQRQAL